MADPEKREDPGRDDDVRSSQNVHREDAFADTMMGVGPSATPSPTTPTPAPSDPAPTTTKPGVAERPVALTPSYDEEPPDPLVGRVLSGLYKVQQRIGEGGMGTVYLALHIHLNKQFAVKVLSSKIAANKEAVERLRQEAIAASSIEHDNIVQVVNFDLSADGDVFIVMELLRGQSLAEVIEKGPLPLDKALHVAWQICRALQAAHDRGIVHRDLKPENVHVIRKEGVEFTKVLDFGISKIRSAEAEQVRMTKTGQLVGTPLYMSPEQAKGEADVDLRADIYALGVMLYEMLTGTTPFIGSNYFQLLWKHGNEPPELPSKRAPRAKIPPGVEAAIMKALSKSPSDRFQSMKEFEEALIEAAPDIAPPARIGALTTGSRSRITMELEPQRSPALVWGAAAVVAIAIAAGIGVAMSSSDGDATTTVAAAPRDPVAVREPGPTPTPPPTPAIEEEEQLPIGAEPPPVVAVRFDSTPGGAQVRVGDDVLGVTPLVAPLTVSDTAVDVHFSLRNHVSEVVSVIPAEGARVTARLRPVRRGGGGGGKNVSFKTEF